MTPDAPNESVASPGLGGVGIPFPTAYAVGYGSAALRANSQGFSLLRLPNHKVPLQ